MEPVITTVFLSTAAFMTGYMFSSKRKNKKTELELDHLAKERDEWKICAEKYKKIAKSHEITYKDPNILEWETIDELQYDDTIDNNFKKMRRDLEEIDSSKVKVTVRVFCFGSWTRWLRGERKDYLGDHDMYTKAPNWDFKDPGDISEFGRLNQTFIGRPEDIAGEFERFFKNPHWGFHVGGADKNDKGEKIWGYARPVAAVRFKLNVMIPREVPVEPNIQFVEVAVKEPSDLLKKKAEEEVSLYLAKLNSKAKVGI